MIGIPDSWSTTIPFSDDKKYKYCTWSPCCRFIAALTRAIIEIQNQLTLKLVPVLQHPKNIPPLTGPLAYSPDGRSLACCFPEGIIIWDIQTGGVAGSINCHSHLRTLVWSLDGRTIAITLLSSGKISCVKTYDVASLAQLLESKISSNNQWVSRHWAHEKSFRT